MPQCIVRRLHNPRIRPTGRILAMSYFTWDYSILLLVKYIVIYCLLLLFCRFAVLPFCTRGCGSFFFYFSIFLFCLMQSLSHAMLYQFKIVPYSKTLLQSLTKFSFLLLLLILFSLFYFFRWSARSCVDKHHYICQHRMPYVTEKNREKIYTKWNETYPNQMANEVEVVLSEEDRIR